MSVSRSPAPSSIDLSGVPARVAEAVAQVVAVCHEQFRSDPCPEAFEEAELRVRETMNALACELLGAVIEKRCCFPVYADRSTGYFFTLIGWRISRGGGRVREGRCPRRFFSS